MFFLRMIQKLCSPKYCHGHNYSLHYNYFITRSVKSYHLNLELWVVSIKSTWFSLGFLWHLAKLEITSSHLNTLKFHPIEGVRLSILPPKLTLLAMVYEYLHSLLYNFVVVFTKYSNLVCASLNAYQVLHLAVYKSMRSEL